MKTQAIIPAAGLGKRFDSDMLKPFYEINGIPIFIHTLKVFEKCEMIESIILVANNDKISEYEKHIRNHNISIVSKIIIGGETRSDSVSNGLKVLDATTKLVCVHDGVRPLVSVELIHQCVTECEKFDAVVLGVPVKATIKRIEQENQCVSETLNRDELWEIQTPQVFKKEVLIKAHGQGKGCNATDDAALVERLGAKVKVIKGSYKNIKITTMDDVEVASSFLKSNSSIEV